MVGVELLERARLAGRAHLADLLLGKAPEVFRVPLVRAAPLVRERLQLLRGILVDRFEHHEVGLLRARIGLRADEGVQAQLRDVLHDVRGGADGLGVGQGETAGEDGQLGQQRLGLRVKEIMRTSPSSPAGHAGGPGGPGRATAGVETLGETVEDLAGRHADDAGGRQLDGERQPLQAAAQLRDVRRVVGRGLEIELARARALHEEPFGVLGRQRRDIHELFEAQPRALRLVTRHLTPGASISA